MENDCQFCSNIKHRIIYENDNALIIWDKYPVSRGHLLIISKQHTSSYFDLDQNVQKSMCNLIPKAKEIIELENNPRGYNIGLNIGEVAGQSIFHCHIHVIPRYLNDSESPKGGIRKVINGIGEY